MRTVLKVIIAVVPAAVLILVRRTPFEAFFQALWNRTWIEGIFTFGYTYTEIPLFVDPSTRAKPAEGVLSKYNSVLPPG